ncbi:MAG: hypothetical protein JW854_16725 [Actinobacteria bacterium]|nr:hypothetical protein [Actinomycetota bacterium]
MYWTIFSLMVAGIVLAALIYATGRFENSRYGIMRNALMSMKKTGSFEAGNKVGETLSGLNVTNREQLDRYATFYYCDLSRATEKQKTHILVAALLLGSVFAASLIVPAIFAGDASRHIWVERIYMPLSEILLSVLIFMVCLMLSTRSSAKKIMWIFWEYLQTAPEA